MKRYGDAKAVAALLKFSTYTIADMFRRGVFPKHVAFRVGRALRWDLDELEKWCAAGATDQQPASLRVAK